MGPGWFTVNNLIDTPRIGGGIFMLPTEESLTQEECIICNKIRRVCKVILFCLVWAVLLVGSWGVFFCTIEHFTGG